MIPILYDKSETLFTHNGIGLLTEAVKVSVTEERNGSYELSLQYPITGRLYSEITDGAIIKAKVNETSEPQLFRIYKSSKPLKGIITYSAEHISYDLNGIPLLGFSIKNATPQMAITQAIENAGLPCSYSILSDISTLNSTVIPEPCSVRALLGGQTGSILDVWGGEYEFDNFNIKLHTHRGTDNGVTIEYGKNLKDINQETNIAECYTHLMPYAVYTHESEEGEESNDIYVYLNEKVIPLTKAENIGHSKAYIMDFSDRFSENETITEEKLRAKATAYAKSANLGAPKVNLTVSFVQLWQTEEYKNIAPLERVKLCDIVTVRFLKLGIEAKAKVIKTVYNSLEEKYESITLGDAKSSFANTINKQTTEIEAVKGSMIKGQAKAAEELKKAIANATSLITGHSGGYVVLNPAEMPQEILILDKPTIEDAANVWRWNSGGLGHSKTGYNGNFTTAITADGSIVADFITAGILNGSIIKADSIQASAISAEYKSQVSSAIRQTSEGIMTEVNKKVNDADFGTKITQNYSSVRIAWNNISKYIEFSNGAINVYQSTAQGHENLLMQMNSTGAWYYNNGTSIGKIGTNTWEGDSSYKGLVFDLEHDASYMCWAHKESANASAYTVKLIYYADDKKESKGLHFNCNTYCGGNLYLNDNIRTVVYTDGSGGLYSNSKEVHIRGVTARLTGGASFVCDSDKFIFYNSSNLLVDCYNNIDLHNYSILNQSDARYKTNIANTDVNALEVLQNIQLKSFDWIESGEHCDIGMIAQQLREVLPELVDENAETKRLSIKTDKFIPYLIKAIQELAQMNVTRSSVARMMAQSAGSSITYLEAKEEWQDNYTDDEKRSFIANNKLIIKENEMSCHKDILIPINKTELVEKR